MDLRESFNNKGRLFVISGPSGAGKGTICGKVMERLGDTASLSVSATTRQPREGEVDGVNYYFLSKEEFEGRINNNGFLEYAEVYDHYYGTSRENVMDKLESGKDVFLEIDIQGAMQVKDSFPEAVFIFILPPSMEVLKARITGRNTDSEEVIDLRMSKAADEISYVEHYDYAVVNDDLETAIGDVMAIIRSEKIRTDFTGDELDEYISSFGDSIGNR
ncbi:MAG: guanylate kinase [Eubacteriales bacterium]|nr:guanylate kinase [Eubacteriales bacterium]